MGILVMPAAVMAQDKTLKDSIDEVTVNGTNRARDYRSTAPSYSITHESLSRMGVTDISSALSRLPGITLKDYGGAGGLKTVSVRGFGAQHTTVVYDGIALSNSQSGSIDVARYSMDNVSDLKLIVGDNDDIFQPARNIASAASLFINTLRMPTGDNATHATAQIRTGSWGYINPHLRLDRNISSHLGLSFTGDYLHADNDYPYAIVNVNHMEHARRKNSRMNSGNAELSMAFTPGEEPERNILTMKAYYYNNARQLPGMVHYYVNDSRESKRDENAFLQLGWNTLFSEKLRFSLTGKMNYLMTAYKDPAYPGGVKDHQYWQREYYTSACLLYTLTPHLALDYSADYAMNNLTGGDVSVYRSPVRHTILQTLVAKWHNSRFTIVGRLLESLYYNKAIMGESAKDINHLSPSLSVSYRLLEREDLYLRLSYKDIFRAPSFMESYYEHYGSTDLDPERTSQVNLGITWTHAYGISSRVSLTVDGYMNEVKDKIVSIPYDMFKWTNVNLGSVHTKGLDVTAHVQHQLSRRHLLIFTGNYTMQHVQDKTGGRESKYYNYQIAYTPVYSGGMSLAWENPWVNISSNALMVSSRWPNNEHYQGTMLPGYTNVGITAYRDLHLWKTDVQLRFDVKNIFDKQYEIVGNYPMPGRSWMTTIKLKI